MSDFVPHRKVHQLRDLIAWNVAMDFAEQVYQATAAFPASERFCLQQQIRRAAVSVAANIAEGHGRANRKEFAYFVSVARGPLKEAETLLRLAARLGFLSMQQLSALESLSDRLSRLLTALRQRLRGQR